MLILSRKMQESIIIGEDIKVMVLSYNDWSVKLGISAPKHISICREEIYSRYHPEFFSQINDDNQLTINKSKIW